MVMLLSSHRTISRPSFEVAGKPDRLVVDALHEAAVAGDDEGAVIDQVVAVDGVEVALGDRHADRHRDALAERTGRDLDSRQARNSPGWPAVGEPSWRKRLMSSSVGRS